VSAASPQNDAAPRLRRAASVKTNPAEEPHNSSRTQPPGRVGPRLYRLKPICPGFSTTDWIKLRRWQRMKDHARWITDFILEAHERTLFVTVTFSRFESDERAKELGRRFFQKWLAPIIEGYVRVIERQGNERAHIHWIFRLVAPAIACGCKIIQLSIKWHGRRFGFGRCEVEPVRHPERLAWYLVKSFKEGALRATGKVVTYSNNICRVKYATDSYRWQHAVRCFAEKLGCATKQELTKKLGIGWPFRYRRLIYSIGARA
jgi:hypothetical protein